MAGNRFRPPMVNKTLKRWHTGMTAAEGATGASVASNREKPCMA